MQATLMVLLCVVVLVLLIEYRIHCRHLKTIPIRIHVNGTRGKSSVTRLIAGALREQGLKTFAKTTGTLPRMIMDDGWEYPIYRPTKTNIIEQLRIVSLAAHNHAEALVVECMALQPIRQSLTELKFIQATHGVITNARLDHLDVMGPTERDVALALLGTTPYKGKLFTAEDDFVADFQQAAIDRQTELYAVRRDDIEAVGDTDMAGFTYVEHKENVALVLNVCASLGIPRDVALRGMWKAQPDPGVMREYVVDFFGRRIIFVNGFAANDPESSARIWHMALATHPDVHRKIMILNARADRVDRSKQLAEAIPHWQPADHYVLIGSGVYHLFRIAIANGIDARKVVYAEGMPAEHIFEEVVGLVELSGLVMGLGNIGGPGLDLLRQIRNRTVLPKG